MERETPYSPKHCPVVKQEAPSVFKEQFVPPDLSIWDYLITKVILRVFIIHVQFSSVSMQLCQNYILGISLCDVVFFSFRFYVCVLQPTLPPSENRTDYDSEDSQNCQDEDDDDDEFEDAFEANAPQKEHSNHNSYR